MGGEAERTSMTKTQAYGLIGIGAVVTAALVVLHLVLPTSASWAANRALHYAWEGGVAILAAGGATWLLWPRPKERRKDQDRVKARRRLIGLMATILVAVGLIIFCEVHRQLAAEGMLKREALPQLEAIGKALAEYKAAHSGALPGSLADLVPQHLQAGQLYYAYRNGPAASPAPAAVTKEGEEPSYVLAKEPPLPPDVKKRRENRLLAYLRAGHAWAPLTAVLEKDGKAHVTGDDVVRAFEKQMEPYK
jgi:hypothetical protein